MRQCRKVPPAQKWCRSLSRYSICIATAIIAAATAIGTTTLSPTRAGAADPPFDTLEELGGTLFADRNLSISRAQSCVSCHSPQVAFTDPRELGAMRGAVSLGALPKVFGDRNAPTLTYAAFAPPFRLLPDGEPFGGFFHDGRARNLEELAGQPVLDPREMALPDKRTVLDRLREKPAYRTAFVRLFTADAVDDEDLAFSTMSRAIAAFLRTSVFAPFDSRYDRFLSGAAELTALEKRGRDLFFANERPSCSSCHTATGAGGAARETFTNFRYYNLGTPPNETVRKLNGSRKGRADHGVMLAPAAAGPQHDGKFKVPTLRNVAITAPYMHNGAFQELGTVLAFHTRFADGASRRGINPETKQRWGEPEVPATVQSDILSRTLPLGDEDIEALVAFLGTLTDRRYEQLLAR